MPTVDWKSIQDILISLVGLVFTFCLPFLAVEAVRWLQQYRKLAEAKVHDLTGLDAYDIDHYIEILVNAAEQYLGSQDGKARKAWVLSAAQLWLASKGVTLDLGELDARIEAAVYTELNKDKQPAAPVKTP